MPTTRPRYQVTETDEVARALDDAERRWPGEPRSRLLVRLIVDNGSLAGESNETETARRRAAIESFVGDFSDAYPPGYLADLRDEWPQ